MLDSSLVFCTLLGPEGPDRVRKDPIGPLDLVVTGFRVRHTGYRPYFENYTVDASILDRSERIYHNDDFWLCSSGQGQNSLVNLWPFGVSDRFKLM